MIVQNPSERVPQGALSTTQDNSVSDEIDLSQLARTLWRGKFFITFCAVIALIVGIWYAYVQAVPVYTSSTTITLEPSEQLPSMDITSAISGGGGDQTALNTGVEVLR